MVADDCKLDSINLVENQGNDQVSDQVDLNNSLGIRKINISSENQLRSSTKANNFASKNDDDGDDEVVEMGEVPILSY